MPRERIVGIDTGGTLAKAAVFALDGTELGSARQPNRVSFPEPGHTEVDAEDMWASTCRAVRGALEASGTAPGDVLGVSTTGHGNGLYAVDRAGSPVMAGIISTDSRAEATGAGWRAAGHAAAAEAVIMQRFWPGQTLALLGWFGRHRPGALDRAATLYGSKDYIRARLTGDRSTEITEAAVSGLADLNTGRYASDLFERLGLGRVEGKLPPIEPSLAVGGRVSAGAAAATGLKEGTPVVRGLTDVVACAVASGVQSPDTLSMVAGTFSINQTLHRSPRRSSAPVLQIPYPIDELFLATECSATSASNLEWLCRTLLGAEAERAAAGGRSIYEVCGAWVADALDRPSDILFLPFLFGGPDGAPAGLIGLKASHGTADVMRAVFEGIAFAHRLDLDKLMTGPDAAAPRRVRFAGGAARSPVWPQIFADVLDLPVEVTEGGEMGALGAAMSVAAALGPAATLPEAIQAMVRVARRHEPDPGRAAAARAKFTRFEAVVRALGTPDAP